MKFRVSETFDVGLERGAVGSVRLRGGAGRGRQTRLRVVDLLDSQVQPTLHVLVSIIKSLKKITNEKNGIEK